jgi:hypothetical protein
MQVMDGRGWLPIHWCAFNGHDTDVFNMIFESYPGGIYRHTMKGQLPFQLSLSNRKLEMIESVFLENEDAIEAVDYKGNCPAHDAARNLNPEGLKRLLSWKPDAAMTHNMKGDLPIHRLFQNLPKVQRVQWRQLETAKVGNYPFCRHMFELNSIHCFHFLPILIRNIIYMNSFSPDFNCV